MGGKIDYTCIYAHTNLCTSLHTYPYRDEFIAVNLFNFALIFGFPVSLFVYIHTHTHDIHMYLLVFAFDL